MWYSGVLLIFPISRKPGWAELIELGGPAGEQGPFSHRLVTSFLYPSTTVSIVPYLQTTLLHRKKKYFNAWFNISIMPDAHWYDLKWDLNALQSPCLILIDSRSQSCFLKPVVPVWIISALNNPQYNTLTISFHIQADRQLLWSSKQNYKPKWANSIVCITADQPTTKADYLLYLRDIKMLHAIRWALGGPS